MKKMRAYLNVGRLRLNMALKRDVINNYPVKGYIEPTLFCNLRCPACPTGLQLGLRPSATIDVELFKGAIDEVGDYLFELWVYNWGEPLLHRQTPEMIRYAKDKEMVIRLSTNLSIKLTDDYIDRLVRSGLDHLVVSLDGTTAETYGKYRLRGDFDLVRQNMKRIQAAKARLGLSTPNVIWQFLVFKHNEHEIDEALAEYKAWGADELNVCGAELPRDEFAEGFEPSTIPQYNLYHPDHVFQQEMKRYHESGKPCSWLYGVLLLNPNGKVSACCAVASEKDDFGDYSPGGLFKVWNGNKFRRARSLVGGSKRKVPVESVAAKPAVQRPPAVGNSAKGRVVLPIFNEGRKAVIPAEEKLICHSCPIPNRQNEALLTIDETAAALLRAADNAPSLRQKLRPLFAYLLMGAPDLPTYARAFTRAKLNRILRPRPAGTLTGGPVR